MVTDNVQGIVIKHFQESRIRMQQKYVVRSYKRLNGFTKYSRDCS